MCRTTLSMLSILLLLQAAASAQGRDSTPNIVAGLNNGVNKIYLEVKTGEKKPTCLLAFCRLTDTRIRTKANVRRSST